MSVTDYTIFLDFADAFGWDDDCEPEPVAFDVLEMLYPNGTNRPEDC